MSKIGTAEWLDWKRLPLFSRYDAEASLVQMCDRLLEEATRQASGDDYIRQFLPQLATELSCQWCTLIERTPEWETLFEFGRNAAGGFPSHLCDEALDRDAAGLCVDENRADWSFMAAPLGDVRPGTILLVGGRDLNATSLSEAIISARALGYALSVVEQREKNLRRIKRLQTTLHIASSFSSARETQPLLELIAKEATRLLESERSSIFIWDREHKQVVACPALGVEGNTLRLPDDVGIVGDVIRSGKTICVDDAYNDERFDPSVDKSSGFRTHNLLCVPLRNNAGELIGAFEVMNKEKGKADYDDADAQSLEELGVQAATALENTREIEQLSRSRDQLTEQVKQKVQIIGKSSAITALRSTIERLAGTDLPVLILGESGTGKEVVSQSLHYQGPRANTPFIAVNCAALTETLLESELFGHEKGAFTDAHETRAGKFELAEGGTLFLDEIGDMSPGGQAKLLRVLEQKVVTRVGGSETIPINVRVVAATNAKLADAVRDKKFREDLYYRLSVVTLDLPPLRDRPEDVILLAEFFLAQFCSQANRRVLKISAEAKKRLQAHLWPGNVRELRNLMERVAFLCAGDRVEVEDLAFILSPARDSVVDMSADLSLKEASRRFQQEYIRRTIKRVGGNMSETAKCLGLHRSNLYRKMGQLDMHEANEGTDDED
ncbi:sigma-54-dependent Fis family transcriptional regulator [Gimesia maris]|uniref:sigma-54-dependent Fis family transcriptional regulator n=1 Tax=Gimesia maris TaxID=122 RepID=UPI00118890E5|nr:sigma-54-dependent Fis family transcriptional regulator [Gimesia maris]QDT81852.1 Nitrogen fixation protein VnfA [Gimesia maris]